MTVGGIDYVLIDTQEGLDAILQKNQGVGWMGFDTEFIGEKRYHTLLCLIQISTEHGYYSRSAGGQGSEAVPRLPESPDIVKVTHAGDNDYRLLYRSHGIVPQNVFDTQVAAAFIGTAIRSASPSSSKPKPVTTWERATPLPTGRNGP